MAPMPPKWHMKRTQNCANKQKETLWWTDTRLILTLIAIQGFLIRIFSIVKHEALLHEYDPYFNYKCTEFIHTYGIARFWHAFDEGSWYPLGRMVGQTTYPGLMILAYATYRATQYLGIHVSLKTVCVVLPPLLNNATVYAVYKLTTEISRNECAALTSAFFVASLPALIARTAAGAYDNEALAVPLMVYALYKWLAATKRAELWDAAAAALVTFLMALSWGGYVFVVNAIASFTLAAMILNISPDRVTAVYIVYHALTVTLCYSVPVIANSVITTTEMKVTHVVFAIAVIYIATNNTRRNGGRQNTMHLLALAIVATLAWILTIANTAEYKSSLTERLNALVKPAAVNTTNPLVASISEHQPTRWNSMILDFWVTLMYNPIGIYVCFKQQLQMSYLALTMYGVLASYFAAAMVRLSIILAPAAAILSGIGITYTLDADAAKKKNKARIIVLYTVTATLMMAHVTHSTWVASTIYSNTNIMTSWHNEAGERIVADDFRDAYSWMRHNIKRNAVVMAWWDYGYQLKQMANCTVMTDNNTSNYQQIALTAMIFASKEQNAYRILTQLNVQYVMVVYGGIAKFEMDDISKFPWMVKIAANVFPQVQRARLTGRNAKNNLTQTLLYKLCRYGVDAVSNYDNVRKEHIHTDNIKLEHFTEAFTSEHWLVRIYRVNENT